MILSAENYYSTEANMEFMSVSQFKNFLKCEYYGVQEATGNFERPKSTALLVGSYIDAHFEKTLDLFKAQNPELFKRDGSLKAEYVKAEDIISRIERDKMFMDFLDGEKQTIMTGSISGVPIKIKMDVYQPGKRIVDLKVMRDFMPIYVPGAGRLNFIEAWNYDFQAAVYQEIVRQNTGEKLPFFIAAATKEEVPDIGIFEIPDEVTETALLIFADKVNAFDAIKKGELEPERCERCDACKLTKNLTKITTWEELSTIGD